MGHTTPMKAFIKGILPVEDGSTVEMIGNHRAIVEDADGIVEYEDGQVRVKTGKRIVTVTGRRLTLESYDGNIVVVSGNIAGVRFD